jgi:L,D-transpeptidase ErfK/SrfK
MSASRRLALCAGLLCGSVTAPVLAAEFSVAAGDDLIGSPGHITSVYDDTLIDIARAHQLGYEEIRLANPGVDAWLPGEGTDVRLPMQFVLPNSKRTGIIINIAEYRMYYYFEADGDKRVRTFPISIGRMDWGTPLGRAAIVKKVRIDSR